MEIRNNIYSQANPQFGQKVILNQGVRELLKLKMKPEDWQTFDEIIENHSFYSVADIVFWSDEGKRLIGRVVLKDKGYYENKGIKLKDIDFTQHFWNSTIGFIKKVAASAEKFQAKVKSQPDININNILKKTEEY